MLCTEYGVVFSHWVVLIEALVLNLLIFLFFFLHFFLLAELHADLFCRHASSLVVFVLWWLTKEVNMLCPMRFLVDATENSKQGGVAAEV